MKDSLLVIANTWLQLLLQRVAQAVIRFRGQLLFHLGPGRFGQLFSLNKWNHYFKTAFYIYSGCLCVMLKLFDDLNLLSVKNMQKKKQNRKGTKTFSRHCIIYIYIYIYTHTHYLTMWMIYWLNKMIFRNPYSVSAVNWNNHGNWLV